MNTIATTSTSDTIVLIHGLWMTPRSWERWVEHYEQRGFKVLAPAYPGLEGRRAARRDRALRGAGRPD
ncbi:esterase/lipase family protein [Sorangium sp. So ce233]|uniref:esterase/lipase family protein n=1 Tax=Sorangium sp. So ce233 TaxID=3133290 RepID=UPI003F610F04